MFVNHYLIAYWHGSRTLVEHIDFFASLQNIFLYVKFHFLGSIVKSESCWGILVGLVMCLTVGHQKPKMTMVCFDTIFF